MKEKENLLHTFGYMQVYRLVYDILKHIRRLGELYIFFFKLKILDLYLGIYFVNYTVQVHFEIFIFNSCLEMATSGAKFCR